MGDHSQFYHQPVLLSEVKSNFITNLAGIYLDGTLGGGGHAESILKILDKNAQYIGLDQDIEAIRFSQKRLKRFTNITYHHCNFAAFDTVLEKLKINSIDGILLDLGLSSYQIDTDERGFSYMKNTALDMRMDRDNPNTASDLLNTLDEDELSTIFFTYGEERRSRQIAKQVVEYRKHNQIIYSNQLREVIDKVVHPRRAIKSYARIFQSLRIVVNRELDSLEETLNNSLKYLNPGGRCAVIAYHSLEDRIVKNFMKEKMHPCTCPPEFPKCICGKTPELKLLSSRAIQASDNEILQNPRARSAHLRVGEKL